MSGGIFNLILNAIFPVECLWCEAYGTYLCGDCASTIHFSTESACLGCKRQTILGGICAHCSADFYFERILIGYPYDDELIQKLIWQLKFNEVRGMAVEAGNLLYRAFDRIKAKDVLRLEKAVIVPIPLHRKKETIRGFNQAAEIADSFAKRLQLTSQNILTRVIATSSQRNFDKLGRELNIRHAFAISPEFTIPETVILLDDVVTTGSTLNEAAAVLKEAGVKRVIAVALAKRDN